jgi:class 3 adenylate cyclase
VSPDEPPTLEVWVEDAIAVLDAVGSRRAVVLAACEMSSVGLLLAATHPDRVESLVVVNSCARALVDVDYPAGLAVDVLAQMMSVMTDVQPAEGADDFVFVVAPSAAHDPDFRKWWWETGRRGASPATARALISVEMESDVRGVLSSIHAPTLVVHFRDEPLIPVALGRYVAERVPDARWVEVPGADDMWWVSDRAGEILDQIEEFVTGARGAPPTNRVLSTVLFTDIVASTERANELGDRRRSELLDSHDATVRRQLTRFRGTEVNTTGDGFVAMFDGPGIGVHIAARVAAAAEPSTVWVSRTVTDLVIGSGLRVADRGSHELKGVPGTWALYAVADD